MGTIRKASISIVMSHKRFEMVQNSVETCSDTNSQRRHIMAANVIFNNLHQSTFVVALLFALSVLMWLFFLPHILLGIH